MTITFDSMRAAVESADRKTLTWDYQNGSARVFWRGQEIGTFEYVSGGMISGEAVYKRGYFTTDTYSLHGMDVVEDKLRTLCLLQDSLALLDGRAA